FHFAAPFFRVETPFARRTGRARRPAAFRPLRSVPQQRDETCARRLAILRLRAMLAAVDDEDARVGDAVARHGDEPLLDGIWKGGGVNVEAELDGARHFVDVLTARARGADEPLLDLPVVDREVVSDADHRRQCATAASAAPRTPDR